MVNTSFGIRENRFSRPGSHDRNLREPPRVEISVFWRHCLKYGPAVASPLRLIGPGVHDRQQGHSTLVVFAFTRQDRKERSANQSLVLHGYIYLFLRSAPFGDERIRRGAAKTTEERLEARPRQALGEWKRRWQVASRVLYPSAVPGASAKLYHQDIRMSSMKVCRCLSISSVRAGGLG